MEEAGNEDSAPHNVGYYLKLAFKAYNQSKSEFKLKISNLENQLADSVNNAKHEEASWAKEKAGLCQELRELSERLGICQTEVETQKSKCRHAEMQCDQLWQQLKEQKTAVDAFIQQSKKESSLNIHRNIDGDKFCDESRKDGLLELKSIDSPGNSNNFKEKGRKLRRIAKGQRCRYREQSACDVTMEEPKNKEIEDDTPAVVKSPLKNNQSLHVFATDTCNMTMIETNKRLSTANRRASDVCVVPETMAFMESDEDEESSKSDSDGSCRSPSVLSQDTVKHFSRENTASLVSISSSPVFGEKKTNAGAITAPKFQSPSLFEEDKIEIVENSPVKVVNNPTKNQRISLGAKTVTPSPSNMGGANLSISSSPSPSMLSGKPSHQLNDSLPSSVFGSPDLTARQPRSQTGRELSPDRNKSLSQRTTLQFLNGSPKLDRSLKHLTPSCEVSRSPMTSSRRQNPSRGQKSPVAKLTMEANQSPPRKYKQAKLTSFKTGKSKTLKEKEDEELALAIALSEKEALKKQENSDVDTEVCTEAFQKGLKSGQSHLTSTQRNGHKEEIDTLESVPFIQSESQFKIPKSPNTPKRRKLRNLKQADKTFSTLDETVTQEPKRNLEETYQESIGSLLAVEKMNGSMDPELALSQYDTPMSQTPVLEPSPIHTSEIDTQKSVKLRSRVSYTRSRIDASKLDALDHSSQEDEFQTLPQVSQELASTCQSVVFGKRRSKRGKEKKPPESPQALPDSEPDIFDSQAFQDNQASMPDVDEETIGDGKALEDSFDRVPEKGEEPSFKHKNEVVRKQHLRRQMDAFACKECAAYFGGMGLAPDELRDRMKSCRHKAKYAPPDTPPHFWSLSFPSTQGRTQKQGKKQADPPKNKRRKYDKLFKTEREEREGK